MRASTRSLALSLALACPFPCPVAGAEDRASQREADLATVLALRRELGDAIAVVAARHAALEHAAAAVRDGTHSAWVEIARVRDELAAGLAERRARESQAVERLRAAEDADAAWLAAALETLEALEAEHSALREAYLVAKGEHDDLAAELAATVDEFNAAALAYNADARRAGADEAQRLRAMEPRIAAGRAELERRREQALERHAALASAERGWREERTRLGTERAERSAALERRREALAAARTRDARALARQAAEVRRRIAELEATMREELAVLGSARDEALARLERDFGLAASALAEGVDRWLEAGTRDGLFTPGDAARFDRTLPRVDALYAAIGRVETPPGLRVVEEE